MTSENVPEVLTKVIFATASLLSLAPIRVTETGHFGDDGNQAPDARELSLTIFNGRSSTKTIKARDRGFRGDPGSTGTSLKQAGVAV